MFQSMNTIVLTIALLTIMISIIVLRKNPYEIAKIAITTLITHKKMLFSFLALFLILYFNKMEQIIEKNIVVGDFTPYFQQLEGDIIYYIQQYFMNDTLTYLLTFFYIIGFPVIMVSSFVIYLNQDQRLLYAIVYALMLNYMIAIPFYLFFPIYEVWYFDHHVRFLIPQVYPGFDLEYRPLSGIDNNFPSLHTSISLTIALIAARAKSSLFGKITLLSAIFIVFSTFYLGIHWVLDMAAGTILAFIASQTGLRLSEMVVGDRPFELRNQLSSKR
ncbi:phosphatase PAP2 family protein [Tepidibacillus marianensis]|uniref:phosphatase PAP2 family protein n=1 Tax=Tepidibacillus marianensis TaxID=3131995 RepID=UPI0030CD4272